ncbi:MAG TPA: SDR family oxidoreductase [Candidatus Acidoferrales bacterium]|nr:SDR family oxidoreductase [Candidatus Acidoferrales bacterium]
MEKGDIALKRKKGSDPSFRLDGKAAVITGGGSGIGRAIALRFAASGAAVRILDCNGAEAKATAQRIAREGGSASPYSCDVTDPVQVQKAFRKIFAQGRVDILVNNAGISHIGNLEGTSETDFDRVMNVNVKGYFHCLQAAIGHMKSHGGGVILNIASIAGTAGLSDRLAYSTSKGAVIAMTYSVAKDYLPFGIRCNCISPARVHTPFVDDYLRKNYPGREQEMYDKLAKSAPINRMGKPEEVAALALFLCSDEAAFITGVDYPLDGGFFNLHG